jgi:hypothetical protein
MTSRLSTLVSNSTCAATLGVPPAPFTPGTCVAVVEYQRWTVSEFGHVGGGAGVDKVGWPVSKADKIKAGAYTGPLSSST